MPTDTAQVLPEPTETRTDLTTLPPFPNEIGGVYEITTFSGTRTVFDFDDARSLRIPAEHADGRINSWDTDGAWQPLAYTLTVEVGSLAYYGPRPEVYTRTSRVESIRRLDTTEVLELDRSTHDHL